MHDFSTSNADDRRRALVRTSSALSCLIRDQPSGGTSQAVAPSLAIRLIALLPNSRAGILGDRYGRLLKQAGKSRDQHRKRFGITMSDYLIATRQELKRDEGAIHSHDSNDRKEQGQRSCYARGTTSMAVNSSPYAASGALYRIE